MSDSTIYIPSVAEYEQAKKDRDLRLKERVKEVVLRACSSALNLSSLDVTITIADIKLPIDEKDRREIVTAIKTVIPSVNAELKPKGWLLKTQSSTGFELFAVLSKLEQ